MLAFFVVLALLVQTTEMIEIGGVSPNLLLLTMLAPPFLFPQNKEYKFQVLAGISVLIAAAILWMPFWVNRFLVIGILTAVAVFFRFRATENDFLDFAIFLAVSTMLFYLILNIASIGSVNWFDILRESLYNVVLGIGIRILWPT